MPPQTRYAKSGDVSIAYQVVGEGPRDLVVVPGWRYKLLVFVAKHLPESWMLGLMKRNSKKYRKVD